MKNAFTIWHHIVKLNRSLPYIPGIQPLVQAHPVYTRCVAAKSGASRITQRPLRGGKEKSMMCVYLIAKLCPTLLWPQGLPGSSVHGISQARILEWAAISFSWGFPPPKGGTHISCLAGGFFTTEPPGKPPKGMIHFHHLLITTSHNNMDGFQNNVVWKNGKTNTKGMKSFL